MANGVQKRRRRAQNGVQAVFTPNGDKRGRARFVVGLLTTGTGVAVWLWAIQTLGGLTGSVVPVNASSSLAPLSLAMALVIAGVGVCTYSLVVRRTRQETYRIESAFYKLEALIGPKADAPNPAPIMGVEPKLSEGKTSPFRISKTLAVALVEGVMLIVAYVGLVAEYKSNMYMRDWVQANIGFGGYLLDGDAPWFLAATLSGLLGVLIVRLRPRISAFKFARRSRTQARR